MGVNLDSLIIKKEINIEELNGKKFAVDSFNMLYQFLTTIRQPDGSLLTDSKGRITSHLSGLFFRISALMKNNIKLIFVFDGISPELKKEEKERRQEIKKEAFLKYKKAVEEQDIELMKKYASRATYLTKEMIEESKKLISFFGFPIIEAPSEGEAQAAYLVKNNDAYAVLSQDTDSLLFGSSRVIKNLSVSKKRKMLNKKTYVPVNPELIELSNILNHYSIDIDQLIVIAMLCGTDFNIGGIKGIGPKKALELIKKHNKNFDLIFNEVKWNDFFENDWKIVFKTIKEMPVKKDYLLEYKEIDKKNIYNMLVQDYEFNKERVENILNEISKKKEQKGLGDFF
ncbi:MAG: flap endonuclease-1 [Candidatus Woesearchaeota archaeon]